METALPARAFLYVPIPGAENPSAQIETEGNGNIRSAFAFCRFAEKFVCGGIAHPVAVLNDHGDQTVCFIIGKHLVVDHEEIEIFSDFFAGRSDCADGKVGGFPRNGDQRGDLRVFLQPDGKAFSVVRIVFFQYETGIGFMQAFELRLFVAADPFLYGRGLHCGEVKRHALMPFFDQVFRGGIADIEIIRRNERKGIAAEPSVDKNKFYDRTVERADVAFVFGIVHGHEKNAENIQAETQFDALSLFFGRLPGVKGDKVGIRVFTKGVYARKNIAVEVAFGCGENEGKTEAILFAVADGGNESAFPFYFIEISLLFERGERIPDGNSACTEFRRELLFARKLRRAFSAAVGGEDDLQEIIFDLFI